MRNNKGAVQTINVTDYLDQNLCEVYECERICDKFDYGLDWVLQLSRPRDRHAAENQHHYWSEFHGQARQAHRRPAQLQRKRLIVSMASAVTQSSESFLLYFFGFLISYNK